MNPIARTFLIASRAQDGVFWENEHFGNRRDKGLRPRLVSAPGPKSRRGLFGRFRTRQPVDPADL